MDSSQWATPSLRETSDPNEYRPKEMDPTHPETAEEVAQKKNVQRKKRTPKRVQKTNSRHKTSKEGKTLQKTKSATAERY